MEWSSVNKAWDKWASHNIGSSNGDDRPLKAALLLNYDPVAPSRLLSVVAHKQGIDAKASELTQFLDFFRHPSRWTEFFFIGSNQYLVTSIHENWLVARCMNTAKPGGGGAVVMQAASFLLVGMYDGSIGSASRAVVAVDQLAHHLGRRNL